MKTYIYVLGFGSFIDRFLARKKPADELIELKKPRLTHHQRASNSLELENAADQILRLGCSWLSFEVVETDPANRDGEETVLLRTNSIEQVYEFLKKRWLQGKVAMFYFDSQAMAGVVARDLPEVSCTTLQQALDEFKRQGWQMEYTVVGSLREYTHALEDKPITVAVGLPNDGGLVQVLKNERHILAWIGRESD